MGKIINRNIIKLYNIFLTISILHLSDILKLDDFKITRKIVKILLYIQELSFFNFANKAIRNRLTFRE